MITNNPDKIQSFSHEFQVEHVPLTKYMIHQEAQKYMQAKVKKHGLNYGLCDIASDSQHEDMNKHKGLVSCNMNTKVDTPMKICIISTCWNATIVDQLVNECMDECVQLGVKHVICEKVPGSWELPYLLNQRRTQYDAIICIGVLIKGETKHFDYIAQGVFEGIMKVQLESGSCPIINGVLTVLNEQQAMDRISLARGWAQSAIHMVNATTN